MPIAATLLRLSNLIGDGPGGVFASVRQFCKAFLPDSHYTTHWDTIPRHRIIVDAIKVAQELLCQNLPAAQNISDATTVMRFRESRPFAGRTIGVGAR
jgi:hypothetical protein